MQTKKQTDGVGLKAQETQHAATTATATAATKKNDPLTSTSVKNIPESSSSKSADPLGDSSAPVAPAKAVTATDLAMQKDGAEAQIPASYNRYQAPKNDGKAVEVHFRVLVQYFYSISQRDELLDFGLKVFKMWKDERLTKSKMTIKSQDGKPSDGVEVDPSLVWRPQSELRNAIERIVLSEELVVFPTGHVLLTQRLRVKVTVDFNMQWFPFDQQALKFVFATFGRATTKKVVLVTSHNTTWWPAFPNSEVQENFLIEAELLERPQQSWIILSFYGKERVVRGDASLLKYSEVNCLLRVQRGRWHYIIVFVAPMFLIVLVSSANYNFDMRDLEPRITVSASLLLALVALQYSIEQQLPAVTYIMWMNWYLFICYVTISLQVASFILVVSVAGPMEDGTWTKKGHASSRDIDTLNDRMQEIMSETRTDPITGDIVLLLSDNEKGKERSDVDGGDGGDGEDGGDGGDDDARAKEGDIIKSVGMVGEDSSDAAAQDHPLLPTRKGRAVYMKRLSSREKKALRLDWYFRWLYPLMFIFVTLCMFYAVPNHLRLGVVDKTEAAQTEVDFDQESKSNALSRVEVDSGAQFNKAGAETSVTAVEGASLARFTTKH